MTDVRTVDELLSCAANSSDLTLRPERRGDADVLIASGLSPTRLGGALRRLHSEYDAASRVRMVAATDFAPDRADKAARTAAASQATAHNLHETALLLGRLKTLPAVRAALVVEVSRWGVTHADDLCALVLRWWLQPTCPHCDGTKWEVVPGTGRHSNRPCKACRGSGCVSVPGGQEGRRLANYIDDCLERGRTDIARRLRPA